MNDRIIALFITLSLSIFIGIGAILAVLTKRQPKVIDLIMGLAFSLILMLILTDLLPETIELLGIKNLWAFLIFGCLGVLFLKVLDNYIPEHHSKKMTKKEENSNNIIHIGILSIIALVLHNIVEGMAIYLTSCKSVTLGAMMSLGVGLHNVPLGMVVTSVFYQAKQKGYTPFLAVLVFAISSFFGGFILFLFNITVLNDFIIGIFLSFTIGMLLYILVFELWPKVKHSKNRNYSIYGIIMGVLLILFKFLMD